MRAVETGHRKYADLFIAACEMKPGDEHSLEYYRVYEECVRRYHPSLYTSVVAV